MAKVKPVPEGFHTATTYLVLENANKAIEFYRQAFGAKERFRMPTPDGRIAHAEIQIGDSILMVTDAIQEPVTSTSIYLYVPDVDAVYARAVKAGAKAAMPVTDMFWGDRFGRVTDPFGIRWQIATHTEDVPPEEIGKRAAQAMPGHA